MEDIQVVLQSLQIFSLLCMLRAESVTMLFEPKVVTISARTYNIMRKFVNFVRLYFPHITTFFNQILEFCQF